MKILLINSFLYHRGGDCTYLFSLGDLLESKGHEVFYWGMKHPKNIIHKYEEYFPEYIDYVEMNANKNPINAFKVITRSIYSIEAKKKLSSFLKVIKPDVVHLNNIHAQLTPSIIDAIAIHNIASVWSLHDCKLLCPNSICFSHNNYCQKCLSSKFYHCFINKCKKNSFMASMVSTIEAYIHKLFLKISHKIDYFIVSSTELYMKLTESGWLTDKLIKIRYFKDLDSNLSTIETKSYCMYIGNLHYGKGVRTLLDAAKTLSQVRLKIVGDGVYYNDLKFIIKDENIQNVQLLGYIENIDNLIKNCNFVIVPSECFENFPYVIVEANLYGKPVIGSNIGGIPEMINDNITGILFEPGNRDDLSSKILYLYNNPQLAAIMGLRAKAFAKKEYDPEVHYQKLMKVYIDAIKKHK